MSHDVVCKWCTPTDEWFSWIIICGWIYFNLFGCSCSGMLNIWCIKMQVSKNKQTKKQQSDSSSKTYTWGVLGTLHYICGLFECECEWLLSFVFFMMSCNKMVTWPGCNPAFGQRHFWWTPARLQPSREGVVENETKSQGQWQIY